MDVEDGERLAVERERERVMSLTTVKLIIVVSFFFLKGVGPCFG